MFRLTNPFRLPAAVFAPPAPRPATARGSKRVASRRAFLWTLGMAGGAQFALAAALETVRPEWRDRDYGLRLKAVRECQARHPGRPLVLALGSSRVQNGLSPADMPTGDGPADPFVYNFGLNACSATRLRLTFDRLLADGVRPAAVLVEVLTATLGWDGPTENHLAPWAARMTVGDLWRAGRYCGDTGRLWRAWAGERAVPWSAARKAIVADRLPRWVPPFAPGYYPAPDERGWAPIPADLIPEDQRKKMTAASRNGYESGVKLGRAADAQTGAIRATLDRCRREGVRAAVYVMPEGESFRSWYSPAMRRAVAGFLADLRREYGVPVVDDPGTFRDDQMMDSHHLLKSAARLYSRWLWQENLRGWL